MVTQPKWEDKEAENMTEQNIDPDITESSNLTDAEFKTLVIKMLNELRRSVEELSKKFHKEVKNMKMEMEIIKGNQSEMKNTLSEMGSVLNGISIVSKEEDQMTYIKDG